MVGELCPLCLGAEDMRYFFYTYARIRRTIKLRFTQTLSCQRCVAGDYITIPEPIEIRRAKLCQTMISP